MSREPQTPRETKDCRYCRSTCIGDDEPCTSLYAAHNCPWMSESDWQAFDALAAPPSLPEAALEDGPCFYCGEETQSVAGDPGRWPLRFCQPDGTGITRFHHARCVTSRLPDTTPLQDANPTPPEAGPVASETLKLAEHALARQRNSAPNLDTLANDLVAAGEAEYAAPQPVVSGVQPTCGTTNSCFTPPFSIYHDLTEIGDANGHVCTAENQMIAKELVAILNAAHPSSSMASADAASPDLREECANLQFMNDSHEEEIARLRAQVEEAPSSVGTAAALRALEFYANPKRYEGPNTNPIPDDPFQPKDLSYRLDVTRDGGKIARAALANSRPVER